MCQVILRGPFSGICTFCNFQASQHIHVASCSCSENTFCPHLAVASGCWSHAKPFSATNATGASVMSWLPLSVWLMTSICVIFQPPHHRQHGLGFPQTQTHCLQPLPSNLQCTCCDPRLVMTVLLTACSMLGTSKRIVSRLIKQAVLQRLISKRMEWFMRNTGRMHLKMYLTGT